MTPGTTGRRRVPLAALAAALAVVVAPVTAGAAAAGWPVRFEDVAQKAGIDFAHTIGDGALDSLVETMGGGCGWFDYDGDGWQDAYLVSGAWTAGVSDPKAQGQPEHALTSRLYRNRGDGRFADVTEQAGLAHRAMGMGLVAFDYDDDGDQDIYLTNYGPNVLYRNEGDGTFTDVTKAAGVGDERWSVGAATLDYDRDGDLDLFVGNYVDFDPQYRLYYAADRFPGPLSYPAEPDVLFRNNGDGTFTDVTKAAGLDDVDGRAMGVAAADLNGDGWVDVVVANDLSSNAFWVNQKDGTFREVALEAGLAFGQRGESTSAMGIEIADVDGDGNLDVYIPDPAYSCLYRSLGRGQFEDVTVPVGLAEILGQYTGWGAVLADFDHDGDDDLYQANGDIHHLIAEEDVLFETVGKGRFVDASRRAGPWFAEKRIGRGVAAADYDQDGDLDLLLNHLDGRAALLRDAATGKGHWLQVALVGRKSARDADGAVVRVTAGGTTRMRVVHGSVSYVSQHDRALHFGLGAAAVAAAVEITWPTGAVQTLKAVAADRRLVVEEPK